MTLRKIDLASPEFHQVGGGDGNNDLSKSRAASLQELAEAHIYVAAETNVTVEELPFLIDLLAPLPTNYRETAVRLLKNIFTNMDLLRTTFGAAMYHLVELRKDAGLTTEVEVDPNKFDAYMDTQIAEIAKNREFIAQKHAELGIAPTAADTVNITTWNFSVPPKTKVS